MERFTPARLAEGNNRDTAQMINMNVFVPAEIEKRLIRLMGKQPGRIGALALFRNWL